MSSRTILIALWLLGANCLRGQEAPQKSPLAQLSGAIRELTDRVSPAVVEVIVNGYGASDDGGRVANQISRRQSSGSGVVVDSSGYIITNAHVVQGAVNLKVLAQPAATPGAGFRKSLRARCAGRCQSAGDRSGVGSGAAQDRRGKTSRAPVWRLGQIAEKERQGDLVLAIGSPLGLRNSVSMGVVDAAGRAVSDENPILYIQTDASINPGNSGGALVVSGRIPW